MFGPGSPDALSSSQQDRAAIRMTECLMIEKEPRRLRDADESLTGRTRPPVAVPLLIAGLADRYVLPIDAPERFLSWNLNLA